MSGGSKTQTTTQTQQPYKAAQPLIDQAMKQGSSLYNAGALNASANLPYSKATTDSLNNTQTNAYAAMGKDPFNSMMSQFGSTFGAGGFNAPMSNALHAMQQGDGTGYNAEQKLAMDPMRATARGDFLNRTDNNFEDILSRTKESAGTDLSQMMAEMGRFAGGAHQGQMVDRLGGIESQARLGQYNTERDRQTAAANSLFGMGQAGNQNQKQAINDVFRMGQAGMDNTANAGSVWQSLLSGQNAAPTQLASVGSAIEGKQAQGADKATNDLLTLLGIAQGAGQYGTSQAQTPTQNNTMSNMMGGGLGLASLLFGG